MSKLGGGGVGIKAFFSLCMYKLGDMWRKRHFCGLERGSWWRWRAELQGTHDTEGGRGDKALWQNWQHDRAWFEGELGAVWQQPMLSNCNVHFHRILVFLSCTSNWSNSEEDLYFALPSSSPGELQATGTRALAHLHGYTGSSDWRIWGIMLASRGHHPKSTQTGWFQSAEILLLLVRWPEAQTLDCQEGLLLSRALRPGCPISFLYVLAICKSKSLNSLVGSCVTPVIVSTGNLPASFYIKT